ncbi:hypothetical protein POM88_028235 [Heracleum sosnowskyi]|uniref:Ubiquitin-like protease family profile domain-containing protein n=1 Tax=Heracleum sosnowskyi TaxID=360622 RepID=A0AAD8IAI8_9APIA|nr:hypothetical protein POM88_028235 [Heracleum sosnowskyi]
MAKKQKKSNSNEDEKQNEVKALTLEPENSTQATDPPVADCDLNVTSTEPKKKKPGSVRGMVARNIVPIDIPSWPNVEPDLKGKIWEDVQDTFIVAPESEAMILQSAGYIGLEEEEVKAGRLDPDEDPDRAILWKMARKPPKDEIIDEDLAEKFEKIDELLEKKKKGEFKPSGSEDVLTIALETPEHSAEFEKTKDDFEKANKDLMARIAELQAELKAVVNASNINSPMSCKASCRGDKEEQEEQEEQEEHDEDDGCVAIGPVDPSPPEKKDPQKCELAVDCIDNKAVISTYMAYLHTEIQKKKQTDLYAFIDPAATFKLNDHFESYVIERMKSGPSKIFLMPHNENYHWILVIIWESEIFILNPLSNPKRFSELEAALMRAVRSYNAQTGRVNKNPKVQYLSGSPKQPGGTECGYVVMRYMKDIFEDKDMKFIAKWAAKTRKSYKREELDDVRFETLGHIQGFVY